MKTCKYCGCSDIQACAGGCEWIENNLCSKCKDTQESFIEFTKEVIRIEKVSTSGELKNKVNRCLNEWKDDGRIIKDTQCRLIDFARQMFPNVHQNHIRYPILEAFEKFYSQTN